MSDVERLVQAVAENMLRRYGSEYISDHLTWRDFASPAREDVATVLRALAAGDGVALTPPEAFIYHGEATGRPTVYADNFGSAVANCLRSLARLAEKDQSALGIQEGSGNE